MPGPSCWNISFDSLLFQLEKLISKMSMVYADDLSALIAGNTTESLEKKGRMVVDLISK